MTIYISPNPGKTSASEIALRAAQILLTHGAAVLMSDALRENSTAGVIYLPLEQCLERADVRKDATISSKLSFTFFLRVAGSPG